MSADPPSSQPWSRNEGKYDRPSSGVPLAEDRPRGDWAELAEFDPVEAYRGIEPVIMSGDLESIEVEALSAAREPAAPAITESHWQLRLLVERRERIDDEIADLLADRRELMAEVKAQGYDLTVFREVIKRRKMMPSERDAFDALLATCETALGMAGRGVIDGGLLSPMTHSIPRTDPPPLASAKVSTALALAAGASMARRA